MVGNEAAAETEQQSSLSNSYNLSFRNIDNVPHHFSRSGDVTMETEDNFKTISGKKRIATGRKSDASKKLHTDDIFANNRFGIFNDMDFPAMKCATSTNNSNRGDTVKSQRAPEAPLKRSSEKYCPPIFIGNINVKKLIDDLKSKLPVGSFQIKNVSHNKSKLFLKDPAVHNEMMEAFKSNSIDAYTFTPKERRQISVILRGLHHSVTIDEVKEELFKQVPDVIDSIKHFTTKFTRDNNIPTGLFLVTLKIGCDLKDISKVKYVDYQSVKWEKPHASKKVTQCYRCQKWGHIASNCSRPFKCVKCDNKHNPGECQLIKSDTSMPYCTNCEDFGHPANFVGCPEFIKFKHRIEGKNTFKSQITENHGKSSMNRSYASTLRNKTAESNTNTGPHYPKVIEDFLNIAERILNPEPFDLEDRITDFLMNLKSMTKSEKISKCNALLLEIRNHYDV